MTARELRLRERIDLLTDERDEVIGQNERLRRRLAGKRMRQCAYCGAATPNRACASHSDLLRLDPNMAAA